MNEQELKDVRNKRKVAAMSSALSNILSHINTTARHSYISGCIHV